MVQNNLLRLLNGAKIKDMVSIPVMLKRYNMLSANQLNASIKLLEVWKAINLKDFQSTHRKSTQQAPTPGLTK